jgi:hypothetical protein
MMAQYASAIECSSWAGDSQRPVKNQIGATIVERILRAARAGQKYKIIVTVSDDGAIRVGN